MLVVIFISSSLSFADISYPSVATSRFDTVHCRVGFLNDGACNPGHGKKSEGMHKGFIDQRIRDFCDDVLCKSTFTITITIKGAHKPKKSKKEGQCSSFFAMNRKFKLLLSKVVAASLRPCFFLYNYCDVGN